MRKRRTREHIIADLSVHHVEGFVLRCGWTVERTRYDYGIDVMMRTYSDTGEIEKTSLYMQLKATDSLPLSADNRYISLRLDTRDLLFWLNEPLPVILIVYDAVGDRAYWLNVQRYLREQNWDDRTEADTFTIHIPIENRLDEASLRLFARSQGDVAAP